MEHLTLETQAESQAYLNLLNSYFRTAPNGYFWTDAMTVTPKSKTEWFWAKTGKKFNFLFHGLQMSRILNIVFAFSNITLMLIFCLEPVIATLK